MLICAALTPKQCKLARNLLEWSQRALAAESGVSAPTIVRFEAGHEISAGLMSALEYAFARAGVEFSGEPGPGTGVTRITLDDGTVIVFRPPDG